MKILIVDSSLMLESLLCSQESPSLPAMARHVLGQDLTGSWSEGTTQVFTAQDTLVVMNKTDLIQPASEGGVLGHLEVDVLRRRCEDAEVCSMSCKTGEGVDIFMTCLERMLKKMYIIVTRGTLIL